MKWSPRLETERLVLKTPHLGDAPAIARAYAADPEVTRFLTWSPHRRLDDTQAFLRDLLRRQRAGETLAWLVAGREDGRVLGMVEARAAEEGWELGYVLARDAWGRGLMTEAVERIVEALEEDGQARVFAYTDPDNVASARVLEKAGFQQDGVLEKAHRRPALGEEPRDSLVFRRP